ncbi:MAG: hypothetical protein ACRC8J_03390, partial [Phocaeicola sp.]
MKKILYILSIVLFFTGCENVKPDKDTILTIHVPGTPAFPREIPSVKYQGDTIKVGVRTNQSEFTYEVVGEWIQHAKLGNDTILLFIEENKETLSRSGELILTAGNGNLKVTKKFSIIQETQFNLAFDEEDLDENGWLWLNTLTKINKYVGEDKIIQIYNAIHNSGTYDKVTIASDLLIGTDTLGVLDGDNSKKIGGIRLAMASSAGMADDGGSIIINVKSCSNYMLSLSSENSILVGLRHAKGTSTTYENIIIYPGGFSPTLTNKGQYIWDLGAEKNGTILKTGEQSIKVFNMTNRYLYVHGIKLL